MPVDSFGQHLRRAFGVLPTTGVLPAMSARSRVEALAGRDPVTILEAASSVLADVEAGRFAVLLERLPRREAAAVRAWVADMHGQGISVPNSPLHPLAVLAATTLALASSTPGHRSNEERDEIARRLSRVAVRFNSEAIDGDSQADEDALVFMVRSALWREIENEGWIAWTGELLMDLETDERGAALVERFRRATDISPGEWWSRSLGERSTRAVRGAQSWVTASGISPRIEAGWASVSITRLEDAVAAAKAAVDPGGKAPTLRNIFDLTWLTTRPVIEAPDGRRFQLWLGANNRLLLPAVTAQVLADTTKTRYDAVAELLGRFGERRLTDAMEALDRRPGESAFAEADLDGRGQRCDYLIETREALIGFEFKLLSPTRDLSAGVREAVEKLVDQLAAKFTQIYQTLRRRDPGRQKRWLALVVLESPAVVDPLVNARVWRKLLADGVVEPTADEPMTCHVPEFLDLLEYVKRRDLSLADTLIQWRDGPLRGVALDWWLSDQEAPAESTKLRLEAVVQWVTDLLSQPE